MKAVVLILALTVCCQISLFGTPLVFQTKGAKCLSEEKTDADGVFYRIQTQKNAAGKLENGYAAAHLKLPQTETLTVEYRFRAGGQSSRYLLLATSGKNKLITFLRDIDKTLRIVQDGQEWLVAGTAEKGQWFRIRYRIYIPTGRYDLYLNDMTKPLFTDLPFRDPCSPGVVRLYSLGTDRTESVSDFADMKYETAPVAGFPGTSLERSPFNIVNTSVSQSQASVLPLGDYSASGGSATISNDGKFLWVKFRLPGRSPVAKAGEDIRKGDSVSVLYRPDREKDLTLCYSVNPEKRKYSVRCENGKQVPSDTAQWGAEVSAVADGWTVLFKIPVEKKGQFAGIRLLRNGNGRVSSWPFAAKDNCTFGIMASGLPKYKYVPPKAYRELALKVYPVASMLEKARKSLAEVSPDDCVSSYQARLNGLLKEKGQKLAESLDKAASFPEVYDLWEKIRDYANEVSAHCRAAAQFKSIFAPGSAGVQNGFLLKVFPGAKKVDPAAYDGSGSDRTSLELAGGESGGVTVILTAAPGRKSQNVELRLPAGWKGYRMRPVWGAVPGTPLTAYWDILEPGTSFKAVDDGRIQAFYCEYSMPRKGQKNQQEKLCFIPDGGKAQSISVAVNYAGYDLPVKPQLKTAFCYEDFWSKRFYDREATDAERMAIYRFIAAHRLEPMGLWSAHTDIQEKYLDECIATANKQMLFLPIQKLDYAKRMAKKYQGKLRPIVFGFDEVLAGGSSQKLQQMIKAYSAAKEVLPEAARLQTSGILPELVGAVSLWCPVTYRFDEKAAEVRRNAGEEVWWYTTERPVSPHFNYNLSNSDMENRMVGMLSFRYKVSGVLYWALNREWPTNGKGDADILTSEEIAKRGLFWMTPENRKLWKEGKLRFPELPWLSFFRPLMGKKYSPSFGAGNLIYPAPDYQPWASLRLKNIRDGIQDHDALTVLAECAKKTLPKELQEEVQQTLSLAEVIASLGEFEHEQVKVIKFRNKINSLIRKCKQQQ